MSTSLQKKNTTGCQLNSKNLCNKFSPSMPIGCSLKRDMTTQVIYQQRFREGQYNAAFFYKRQNGRMCGVSIKIMKHVAIRAFDSCQGWGLMASLHIRPVRGFVQKHSNQ